MDSTSELFQEWFSLQKNLKEIEFGEREPDLIDGVVPAGNIVFVTGQPKDGKSLIVQGWAHSVATGTPWNGHESQKGAVLYLYPDGEHPRYLAERIRALEIHSGAEVDYERGLRFDDSFSLTNQDQVNNILAGVEYAGLKLLIIDTIAAATPGMDLNNAKEVSLIASFAKEITKKSNGKTTVVIVAHSPKSYSKGVSGSTQLQAMASITYSMQKSGNAKSGFTYRLRVVESRHSAGRYEADFMTEEVEIAEWQSSVVLVPKDGNKSVNSKYQIAFATTFIDLPRGEWIPQAALVKEVKSRMSCGDSQARRWITGALEAKVLETIGVRKEKAFCIPNPPISPSNHHGETTSIPHLSHSLKSGEWGKEGEANNENQ